MRKNCIARWKKSVSEKNSVKSRGKKNAAAKKLNNITKLNWSISKPWSISKLKRNLKDKERYTKRCSGNDRRKSTCNNKSTNVIKST